MTYAHPCFLLLPLDHLGSVKLTFAHPYFLLLLVLLPLLAWWKGKRGQQAAFLYSSVQLIKGVSDISRSSAGRILPTLRWLTLALCIVGLARPQFAESETMINASGRAKYI